MTFLSGPDNPRYLHGATNTPEFRAWADMISRCTDRNCKAYNRYGGRGIKVCERWISSFEDFISDVGPRPSKAHSLDRYPDNDGGYEPLNVRWATRVEQGNNRRNNRMVSYYGKEMTLAEALHAGGDKISIELAHYRVTAGWATERAIDTPARHYVARDS